MIESDEVLSEAYADLKCRYVKLKDIITMLNIKNASLQEMLDSSNKVKYEYQKELQELKDRLDGNTVYRVQSDKLERDYVRLDRYNKVKKDRDMYLELYVRERNKNLTQTELNIQL